MLKPILVAIMLAPTAVMASEVNSDASSQSNSGVYIGGTTVGNNTPGVNAPASNSTAPCVVGQGFGLALPGMGISSTGGRVDKNCETLQEAVALRDLLGNRAAIAHLCKHNKDMRATLVDLGICVVVKRK